MRWHDPRKIKPLPRWLSLLGLVLLWSFFGTVLVALIAGILVVLGR